MRNQNEKELLIETADTTEKNGFFKQQLPI